LDGPDSLIEKIETMGLDGFALTDHETFDGIQPMREWLAAMKSKLIFIPGIEFSTYITGLGEIHILGYFPSGGIEKLAEITQAGKKYRIERAGRIIDCLAGKGMKIDGDKLLSQKDKPIGRMHIARELVAHGYFDEPQEAFRKYIGQGMPCYFPRRQLSPEEAITAIKEAGGISSLAHPMFLSKTGNWAIVEKFIDTGLNCIEYFHPKISRALMLKIEEKAEGRLLLTSGSDYHGDARDKGLGFYGVNEARFQTLFPTIRLLVRK
jgi:predicted metal-dependent phosphoesterase TrpH